ncbi:MAG: hypothetical protein H6833_07340, partial [Planctomycetes bacterium]|nr:hypothetical protein [Planctomycetota bacterium]
RVDAGGNQTWASVVEACLVPSDKLRLANAITPSGVTLLAWTDKRNDAGDVFAQNVNPDGTLGDAFATVSTYGCGVNPTGSLRAIGRPSVGSTWTVSVNNPAGSQPSGSVAYLIVGAQPDPNFPCGTSVPGLGMLGGPGEVLIQLGPTAVVLGMVPWGGPTRPVQLPLPIPFDHALVGFPVYLQGLILDATPGASIPFGLTEGLVATVGF